MLKYGGMDRDGCLSLHGPDKFCQFGIGEAIAAFAATAAAEAGTAAAAVGSTLAEGASAIGSFLGIGGTAAGAGAADAAATTIGGEAAADLGGAGALAGTAGAGAGAALADPALAGALETVTVSAPAAAGISAADLAGVGGSAALGGLAAGNPSSTLASTPSVSAPGIGGVNQPTANLGPSTFQSAPGPASSGGVNGGVGASAAGSAPPPGLPAASPDVTQIPDLGTPATSSQLPGAVGNGAATGGAAPNAGSALTPVTGADATAKTAATSVDKFIDNPSLGSAFNVLKANPTDALSGIGLGYDLLKGSQTPPGYGQIQGDAARLDQQSGQLEGYLTSGQLPPGIQQSLNAATNDAIASIKSRYASSGSSGSSAEAQDIANAQTRAAGQGADIAMQLYNQGVSESGLSAQLYQTIMNSAVEQDNDLASAVGNFSYAMAGGNKPVTPQNSGTV